MDEFRETAGRLGSAVAEPPPMALKPAFLDQIKRARLSRVNAVQAELVDALTAVDARVVIDGDGDVAATIVVSSAKQKLAFVPNRMPESAPDHTYQLWLITPQGTKSGGLLPDLNQPFVAETVPDAQQVAVTVEPAGGSKQPTTGVVMLLALT